MKIGTPLDQLPAHIKHHNAKSKYGEAWDAISKAKEGQWIPITFENHKDAKTFQQAVISGSSTIKVNTRCDGVTVYIRRRPLSEIKPTSGPKAVPAAE